MNNPETYIQKQNRFKTHVVDIFIEIKEAVLYKAPNRVSDFDEMKKTFTFTFFWKCLLLKETNKYVADYLKQKKHIFCIKNEIFSLIL